jgi:hypothetical protein
LLDTRLVWLALIALLLAACAATRIESPHWGPSAAIERTIMRYYERHASEGNCFHPEIDGFTRLSVLDDTPDQLVVHARYLWRDRFQDSSDTGGNVCRSFGERTFTLARAPDGAPVVVGMSGEQDEPALRSVIRRALPGGG